jgi:hypothetical protein
LLPVISDLLPGYVRESKLAVGDPSIKLYRRLLIRVFNFQCYSVSSMLGDIGGVCLTILLVPLLVVGLFILLVAGLVDECADFFQNAVAIGRRS